MTAWRDRGGHLWPKDHEVVTADGTVVRYAVAGPTGAPVIACCRGYLCPDNFWRDLGPDLARDHRVVLVDYRGTGASSEAGGGALPRRASDYRLPRLAGDVAAVLDDLGVVGATLVGHSMGVQVALAVWRDRPELVAGLALLAGPYRTPFATFYDRPTAGALFPLVSMLAPALPRPVAALGLRSLRLPGAMAVARRIRAIGPATPVEGMDDYRRHLARVDPRTAIWTARGMHGHDAEDWLGEVDVPALVAIGDADAWTPPHVGRRLAARLPDAELLVVAGGSHTLPLEFPVTLAAAVRRLTARAVAAG